LIQEQPDPNFQRLLSQVTFGRSWGFLLEEAAVYLHLANRKKMPLKLRYRENEQSKNFLNIEDYLLMKICDDDSIENLRDKSS